MRLFTTAAFVAVFTLFTVFAVVFLTTPRAPLSTVSITRPECFVDGHRVIPSDCPGGDAVRAP